MSLSAELWLRGRKTHASWTLELRKYSISPLTTQITKLEFSSTSCNSFPFPSTLKRKKKKKKEATEMLPYSSLHRKSLHLCFPWGWIYWGIFKLDTTLSGPKRSCAHMAYSDKHSQVLEAPKVTLLGRLSRCQRNYGSPGLTLSAPVWPGLQCQPPGPGTSSLPWAAEKGDGGCRPIFQDWRQFSKQHRMETYYNKILRVPDGKLKGNVHHGLICYFSGPFFFWPEVWMRIRMGSNCRRPVPHHKLGVFHLRSLFLSYQALFPPQCCLIEPRLEHQGLWERARSSPQLWCFSQWN